MADFLNCVIFNYQPKFNIWQISRFTASYPKTRQEEKKLTKGEDFELKSWADLKTLETTPNCGTMKM